VTPPIAIATWAGVTLSVIAVLAVLGFTQSRRLLDLAVVAGLLLFGGAVAWSFSPPEEKPVDGPSATVEVDADLITSGTSELKPEAAVVLVVVTPKRDDNGLREYVGRRYKATLKTAVPTSGPVAVTVARGDEDTNLVAFVKDLEQATQVRVFAAAA
jgi:hypothetical protein